MSDCNKCMKSVKSTKSKIECVDCKRVFHAKCVNLSASDVEYILSEAEVWRCEPCGKTRRKSMRMESASSVTYEDILNQFQEMRTEFRRVELSLGSSIESCHEQVKENTEATKAEKEELKNLRINVEKLISENSLLKNKVSLLESRIEEMEQYNRSNSIEIHGIPEASKNEAPEETMNLVQKVGSALGYAIERNMIDACHRLRRISGKPAGIIVKMVRRVDAEIILKKRRDKKRDFSTRHLDLPCDNPIYVNESLSPARRRLLFHAREAKKTKAYKYLWIRGGKILMRRNDGDEVRVITHMDHLNTL